MELLVETGSPDETRAAGERLGALLRAGDVLALDGELGAGKTCFVQGLARGLGVAAGTRIASPTFTIVNLHAGRLLLYHVDLYRIVRPDEIEEIGLAEYLAGDGVCAIEWAGRFPEFMPAERLELRFEIVGEERRRIVARAVGQRAEQRLAAFESAR